MNLNNCRFKDGMSPWFFADKGAVFTPFSSHISQLSITRQRFDQPLLPPKHRVLRSVVRQSIDVGAQLGETAARRRAVSSCEHAGRGRGTATEARARSAIASFSSTQHRPPRRIGRRRQHVGGVLSREVRNANRRQDEFTQGRD